MIKASYEVLHPSGKNSFIVRIFGPEAFQAPYHFHPECELTFILNGKGKRFVGSNMSDFYPGDLVLLGPKLPHCWKLENKDKNEEADAIVIQFTYNFLGNDFLEKPELTGIQKLLEKSSHGIQFGATATASLKKQLADIAAEKNNFSRLIFLLTILHQLSAATDYTLLDQQNILAEQSASDRERINAVYAYLVENFRYRVNLNQAAAITKMTPNAFCKYFKKITRKTFMEVVIDYRVNYAAQQLVQTEKPVSDICYESGFGDISHFNKMFRAKMNISPLHYRKNFDRHLQENGEEKN